jgi:hypothetical protein
MEAGRLEDALVYLSKLQENLTMLSYHQEVYLSSCNSGSSPASSGRVSTNAAHVHYLSKQRERASDLLEAARLYGVPKDVVEDYIAGMKEIDAMFEARNQGPTG